MLGFLLNMFLSPVLGLDEFVSYVSTYFFPPFLGMTGMLVLLSKEQGLLLLPLLFLWVVIQETLSKIMGKCEFYFFLSALPLGIWLYTWLYSMWYRGLKFAELRQDLETLLNAPTGNMQ